MSLTFRQGRPEDVPGLAHLVAHSFPRAGLSLAGWEARLADGPRGGPETLWMGEEESGPVAVCQLFSLRQWVAGETLPLMGLGTVSIAPTHRRRGLASRLTISGFREALDRGQVATALFPFSTAFYRRLGYGIAGEAQQFRVAPAAFPDDPERAGVRLVISEEDRAAVRRVYDGWAPRQTGQLVRDGRAWELIWDDGRAHGVLHERGGEPTGYAVFRYLPGETGGARLVAVEEAAWLGEAARRGLLAWLGTLGDQWDAVLYRANPEEGFAEHLRELRDPTDSAPRWHYWFAAAVTLYGPMFRLLDLEAAWRLRSVRQAAPFRLDVQVEDEQVPENAGAWQLSFVDGRVEPGRGERRGADATLQIGIEALSRLYIGALSPSAAVAGGLARCDRGDRLERLDGLLRTPKPWTFDRF